MARADFLAHLERAGCRDVRDRMEWRPIIREQGIDFHDRRLKAYVSSGSGQILRRWDISAGFDNLMNPRKECVVYEVT